MDCRTAARYAFPSTIPFAARHPAFIASPPLLPQQSLPSSLTTLPTLTMLDPSSRSTHLILALDNSLMFLSIRTSSNCARINECQIMETQHRHLNEARRAQSSVHTSNRDATLAVTPAECWLVGESVVRLSFDATTRRTLTCTFQSNLSKTTWPWRLRLDRPYLTDSQSRPSPRRPATFPTRLARAAARPAGRHAAKGRFDCSGEERESSKMARF